MTDTVGYSAFVFLLFGILGFQFSPRIAKVNSRNSGSYSFLDHSVRI
ncbi:Tn3 family transposase [Enterococcus sp. BWR-S5]|nr:Tn3 family transposase [Enterococcus sp. BWR-S5]